MKKICFLLVFATQSLLAQSVEIPLDSGWQCRRTGDGQWLKARVPGTVIGALWENGEINDPYSNNDFEELIKLAGGEWEYKTGFNVTSSLIAMDRIELDLQGISMPADILLNDSLILSENHPFFIEEIDVGSIIRRGKNELRIILHSPEIERNNGPEGLINLPRLTKPPVLHAWSSASIREIFIDKAVVNGASATLVAYMDFEMTRPVTGRLEVLVDGKVIKTTTAQLPYGRHQSNLTFTIPDFRVWWPNGMGGRKIYSILIRLKKEDKIIDSVILNAGFKISEVIQKKNGFIVKVNGMPVNVSGVVVSPADLINPDNTAKKYAVFLRNAAAAGFNTVFVTPYFIYEDEFYELCNRYGLLVWQSLVPQDGEKKAWDISDAAISERARKLSRHASLALWLADSHELKEAADEGKNSPVFIKIDQIFGSIIPRKGDTYWYGIPIIDFQGKKSMGKCHIFPIPDGRLPFTVRKKNNPESMKLYGFPSWPEDKTLKYIWPSKLASEPGHIGIFQNPVAAIDTIGKYAKTYCPGITGFEKQIIFSQIIQGEVAKSVLTAKRIGSRPMENHPFLQLNSSWPGITCSLIDFAGRRKAAYYFAKRALNKTLLVFERDDHEVRLHMVNDLPKDFKGILHIEGLGAKNKKVINEQKKVKVKAGENKVLWHMPLKDISKNNGMLIARISPEKGNPVAEALYFIKDCQYLVAEKPSVKYDFIEKDGKLFVKVQSARPAYYVHFDAGDLNLFYSDNFFHLAGKSPKLIEVRGNVPAYEIRNKLTVRTIADMLAP